MKKSLLTFVAICCFSSLFSQFTYGPQFFAGIGKFDAVEEPYPGTVLDVEPGFSYAFGAFGEYRLKDWLSIQLDVLYNQIRSYDVFYIGNSMDSVTWITETNRTARYLSLPLSAELSYKRFDINLGFQLSYLIKQSIDQYHSSDGVNGSQIYYDRSAEFGKYDYSLITGIGYNFFDNLRLEARVNYGVRDIATRIGFAEVSRSRQYLLGITYTLNND